MSLVQKIDANDTGFRIAWEATIGNLPVSPAPVWYPQEPNEYGDFGGQYENVARRPITADAQLKKGVLVDENASGNFQEDLTQGAYNLAGKVEAFMWADFRLKAETTISAATSSPTTYTVGSSAGFLANDLVFAAGLDTSGNNGVRRAVSIIDADSIEVSGSLAPEAAQTGTLVKVGHQFASGDLQVGMVGNVATLTTSAKDMTQLGLVPGEIIFIGGDDAANQFANAVNNNFARVLNVAANLIILDKTENVMVPDNGAGKSVQVFFGRVCKNEAERSLIVRKTAQLERTLGVSDDTLPLTDEQAQYVTGAVANMLTLTGDSTDKIVIDYAFVCRRQELQESGIALKSGSRPAVVEADGFATSADVREHAIWVHDPADSAPEKLFVYAQNLSLEIDNGVTPNKAVKFFGSFDMTRGHFTVTWSGDVYFSTVASLTAIKTNQDVTAWSIFAKANAGIAFDIPLLSVGSDFLSVPADEPITLPVEAIAAKGTKIHANYDHTLLWSFFDYLPDSAMPLTDA